MTVTVRDDAKEMMPRHKEKLAGAETTRPGRMFTPAMDIFETEAAITVLADMPGVKSESLAIDLRENVLTIEGQVSDLQGPKEQMLIQEYDTGGFRREFRLTNLIDQSKIDAVMRNGVLRLTLPKAEIARPRKIEIRTG